MTFILVGNQNCGKTTLFNKLTGGNAHVGNFPGVTVDMRAGYVRGGGECVIDLPGLYSMSPYTAEERIAANYIENGEWDCIINVADATNIERNLYLTLQLSALGKPMILALNMMDEAQKQGMVFDCDGLRQALGAETVEVSAAKGRGINELVTAAKRAVRSQSRPTSRLEGAVGRATARIEALRGCGTYDAEKAFSDYIGLSDKATEQIILDCERETGLERAAALARARYERIEKICQSCILRRTKKRSGGADRLLTHRLLGIPVFFAIILGIFYLTFSVVGSLAGKLISDCGGRLAAAVGELLYSYGAHGYTVRLVTEGVISAVFSVIGFLPTVLTLFFFMSLLEDSGYMARAAFVIDRPMRRLGLSGRAVVQIIMGFGCSVPAIMATRTLKSRRDRALTVMLIPYASCSAKTVIYGAIANAFFPKHAGLVTGSLYFLGIAVGLAVTKLISKTSCFGREQPFLLELPPYRFPSAICITRNMISRTLDFIKRAFSVILICSIIIWILVSMDFSLKLCAPDKSILASIGRPAAAIFRPLGFDDWRIAAALLTGLGAKENVVGTLSVLTAGAGAAALNLSPAAAYSLLVFALLYTPCAAAMCAAAREVGRSRAAIMALMQTAVAYAVSCAAYTLCNL